MGETSFLPQDYVERRMQRRTNTLSLTLFVIVMAGVVGAYVVTDQQRREVQREQEQVANQFSAAAQQLDELARLRKRKEVMIRKSHVTAALVERFPRTMLLAELINRMPTTVSLTSLELDTKVIRRTPDARTTLQAMKAKRKAAAKKGKSVEEDAPSMPETEVTLLLIGLAPTDADVADFMAALGKCDLFNNLNLAFSEEVTIEEQPMRKFRIELMLNQGLDMDRFEPQRVARKPKQDPWSPKVQFDPEGQMVMPGGEDPEE